VPEDEVEVEESLPDEAAAVALDVVEETDVVDLEPEPAVVEAVAEPEEALTPEVAASRTAEVELEPEVEEVIDFEVEAEAEEEEEAPAALEFELPEELLEELDEEKSKVDEAQPKVKKSRAAKKAELKNLIEEDVFDEDEEELPSLFVGDEEEEEIDDEPLVFVVDSPSDDNRSGGRGSGKGKQSQAKGKNRLVLKDLSELRELLDAADRDKRRSK